MNGLCQGAPLTTRKMVSFGFILCFDSFLYTFTVQPIRFTLALWRLFTNAITNSKAPLPPSQKADILRTLLLIVSILILIPLTDASKIYHSIRGQDTIKLYVIFNALEVRSSPVPSQALLIGLLTHNYLSTDSRQALRIHWARYS